MLIEALGYVILWLAFPLVLQLIAARVGRAAEWVDFIVALNWTGALLMALGLPLTLLQVSAAVPDGLVQLVSIVFLAAPFAFEWYLARHLLRVGFAGALGVVMLDFMISLLIQSAINEILAVPAGS